MSTLSTSHAPSALAFRVFAMGPRPSSKYWIRDEPPARFMPSLMRVWVPQPSPSTARSSMFTSSPAMFSRSTATLAGCGSKHVTFAPGHRSMANASNT